MTIVNVKLTEKEKIILEKYGKISDVVRNAIQMYINNRRFVEDLNRIKEYQKKNQMTTTIEEIIIMIRKDRHIR